MNLEIIQTKIFEIRGQKVILDFELAKLYETETSLLKRAVRRNQERFPDDFMFQLTKSEANDMINSGVFQNGTPQYNFSAYLPFAFTEQGVAMLSSVLRNDIAIKINISIMRAFVVVRKMIQNTNSQEIEINELKREMKEIESKNIEISKRIEDVEEVALKINNDLSEDIRSEIDDIYLVLNELSAISKESKKRNPIGYIQQEPKI